MARDRLPSWTLWAFVLLCSSLLWIKMLWPPVARYLYCHRPSPNNLINSLIEPRSPIFSNDIYHYAPCVGWLFIITTDLLVAGTFIFLISTMFRGFRAVRTFGIDHNLRERQHPKLSEHFGSTHTHPSSDPIECAYISRSSPIRRSNNLPVF